jgi:hypothetical protein
MIKILLDTPAQQRNTMSCFSELQIKYGYNTPLPSTNPNNSLMRKSTVYRSIRMVGKNLFGDDTHRSAEASKTRRALKVFREQMRALHKRAAKGKPYRGRRRSVIKFSRRLYLRRLAELIKN